MGWNWNGRPESLIMPRFHFDCPYCGEKLQFGSEICGSCNRPTPGWNRRGGYRALTLIGITVAGLSVVLLLWIWTGG